MTKDNNLLGKFELSGIPPAPRGVPQIEVTFDIDANGILNVSAVEKATQKANKIRITNDKGRLSKEQIDRMVADSERYRSEDEQQRSRVTAKNGLESYCYQIKNTYENEDYKNKISGNDRRILEKKIDETIKWLDGNQSVEKMDYEYKQSELEKVCGPIMAKLYRSGGQGQGTSSGGPTIEEVE